MPKLNFTQELSRTYMLLIHKSYFVDKRLVWKVYTKVFWYTIFFLYKPIWFIHKKIPFNSYADVNYKTLKLENTISKTVN